MQKRIENQDSGKSISSEEKFLIENIKKFTQRLKEKYDYSTEDIINLIDKEELLVPAEIFSYNLAPAESLTKYLKENCDKGFNEISKLINRNEKSLWQNYKRASKKMPTIFSIDSKLKIPISAFADSRLSIFESLIHYLKENKQMKNVKIAKFLGKHPANIWSVYNRAKEKIEDEN